MNPPAARPARSHIYELDIMRPITAFSVVAVHVLSFTVFLDRTNAGLQFQNALVASAHFTRSVFMFMTALTLTYVYFGKPFSARRFWAKRALGVLVPYCLWSMAYTWANNPAHEPFAYAKAALFDIATGSASYQLYYILLTLQFYLILPAFLWLMRRIVAHPWWALGISFVLELILMYVDYNYLQQGPLAATGFWQTVLEYQNRFVLTYQFYFILGGMAALFLEPARTFILRYSKWTVVASLLALVALWVHYYVQVAGLKVPIGVAVSVLQPVMTFYSPGVILFLCWLAAQWARRRRADGRPKAAGLWHVLSDASFGVYLVHAFLLTALLNWVVPHMPAEWPTALKVFLTWFGTAGGAALVTIILLQIPIVSRLVGRSAPWPADWINARLHRSAKAVTKRPGDAQHV